MGDSTRGLTSAWQEGLLRAPAPEFGYAQGVGALQNSWSGTALPQGRFAISQQINHSGDMENGFPSSISCCKMGHQLRQNLFKSSSQKMHLLLFASPYWKKRADTSGGIPEDFFHGKSLNY